MFIAPPPVDYSPPATSIVEVVTPKDVDYNIADLTINMSRALSAKRSAIMSYIISDSSFIRQFGDLSAEEINSNLFSPIVYISPEYSVLSWSMKNSGKTVNIEFSGLLDNYYDLKIV